jgi:rSAM/selenodomain-associated transferase 2
MSQNLPIHPLISVIVPVYKEQEPINAFVRHLIKVFAGHDHEIIVVDGSPELETVSALNVEGIQAVSSGKGRGKQMNAGAARARGRILLFLHSDTRLPDKAPELIFKAVRADKDIIGGAFSLGIDSRQWSIKLIQLGANIRTSLTRVPYGDQAIFIRKDYFHETKGFKEIPIMEDLEMMTRIKKNGGRIVVLKNKAMTSPRRWKKEGTAKCTFRNWFIRILYHCGVSPDRIAGFYR